MPKLSMKAARVNAKIKVEEMAQKLNVHHMTIRRWESGENEPSASQFIKYCEICKMETNDIFLPSEITKVN